jgi:isopropylmalate/homocitrate/citramalate synthase
MKYLLLNKDIYETPKTLHNIYEQYVTSTLKGTSLSLIKFSDQMRKLGFNYKLVNGKEGNKYIISYDELDKIATNKKWRHELDAELIKNENEEFAYVKATYLQKLEDELEKYKLLCKKAETVDETVDEPPKKVKKVKTDKKDHKITNEDFVQIYDEPKVKTPKTKITKHSHSTLQDAKSIFDAM